MKVSRTPLAIQRMFAYTLDMAAIVVVLNGINYINLYFGWVFQASFYLLYFPFSEWLCRGKTLGKFVFRVSVVNGAGYPPTLVQSLIRGATRHLEAIFCFLVIFIYAKSERCQRVGDMLAKTYVLPSKDLAQMRTAIVQATGPER